MVGGVGGLYNSHGGCDRLMVGGRTGRGENVHDADRNSWPFGGGARSNLIGVRPFTSEEPRPPPRLAGRPRTATPPLFQNAVTCFPPRAPPPRRVPPASPSTRRMAAASFCAVRARHATLGTRAGRVAMYSAAAPSLARALPFSLSFAGELPERSIARVPFTRPSLPSLHLPLLSRTWLHGCLFNGRRTGSAITQTLGLRLWRPRRCSYWSKIHIITLIG